MDKEVIDKRDLEIKREDLIAEISCIETSLAARVLILFANWEVVEAYKTTRELKDGIVKLKRKIGKNKLG